MSFVRDHNLWSEQDFAAAADISTQLETGSIQKLRMGWCDQHGLVRGKTLFGPRAVQALENGVGFVGTNLLKDTSDRTAWPVFSPLTNFSSPEFSGASDVILIPDPTTWRELPWSPGTGWLQCQAYFPDGRLTPFDTRGILREQLNTQLGNGQRYRIGLEIEFHIYRIEHENLAVNQAEWPAMPPDVSLIAPGYRLLAEQRYDRIEPICELLREPLQAMGLPLESIEVELGPSQVEFVFGVSDALAAADNLLLFRNAAKQIMRRHGFIATFMCRPALPNAMASGWHLHQSLSQADGGNLFATESVGDDAKLMAPTGYHFAGGLLQEAAAACAFSTPTINGYRRYRPNMLAPDRITWGTDNRGALLRIAGSGDAVRLENRGGEPAANPYLYLASQLVCGMAGIHAAADPGEPTRNPYDAAFPLLPRTLGDSLSALSRSTVLRKAFGDPFIDYYLHLKRAEIVRFEQHVSDWEQREYFDVF